MLEKNIQKTVIIILQNAGFFVIRHNPTRLIAGKPIKLPSWMLGVPDLIVIPPPNCQERFKGKFIGLEIKAENGKQSEHQKARERDILEHGGEYRVIKSNAEARQLIEEMVCKE